MTTVRANREWATAFVERLRHIRLRDTFNMYADVCAIADAPHAPAQRAANLIAMLTACQGRAQSIWIGREPGYRGARRTGLPLTDEIHLEAAARCYGVRA